MAPYGNQTISTNSFYPKRNNLKGGNSSSIYNNSASSIALNNLNRDEKSRNYTQIRKHDYHHYYPNERRISPNYSRKTSPYNRSPIKNRHDYSRRPMPSPTNSRKRKLFSSEHYYYRDDKQMKKSRSNSEEDRKQNNLAKKSDSFLSFKNDQSSSNQHNSNSNRNPFNVNNNNGMVNLFLSEGKVAYRQPPVTIEEVRIGEDKENSINKSDRIYLDQNHFNSNKLHRLEGNNLESIDKQLENPQSVTNIKLNYLDNNQSNRIMTDDKPNNYSSQYSNNSPHKIDNLYPVALRNLGNTCYMNSIVQTLFNLPFLMCELRDSMERAYRINLKLNFAMTKSLVELFEEYKRMRKTQSTNDEELGKRLCTFKHNVGLHSDEFKSSGQHDAVEFLDSVINSIDEEFDKVKKLIPICRNPIDRVFKIELGEASHCEKCNSKSNIVKTKSHCHILSLPEEKLMEENLNWNLQQILKNSFKPEKRESKCEKCDNEERTRYLSVVKPPRVLILQLGRYSATGEKRHESVKVPFEITLPKVHNKESKSKTDIPQQNQDNTFELSGVICHHGSCLTGGHYICFVHDRLNNEWYHCDDENILQTTFDRVQDGSKSSGYCYFYINKKFI